MAADDTRQAGSDQGDELTFKTLLQNTLDRYQGNQSALARAIGVNAGTVNSWMHGIRIPKSESLRQLAQNSPYTYEEWARAVGARVRAPLDEGREDYILGLWRKLTSEEQRLTQAFLETVARDASEDA